MTTPVQIVPPVEVTYSKLTSSNVAETEYGNYAAGTTYALGNRVIVPATHDVWESLAAANTANTPATSPTWWVRVGPTNRMSMFDTSVSSQTTRSGGIDVTVTPGEVVDTVALLNLSAASARIRVTDPVDGLVYDKTTDLTATISDGSWYAWFFEPVERRDYLLASLPAYGSAAIRIELIDTGVAACGVAVLGMARNIGIGTQTGARFGIDDYGRKEKDQWGQYQLQQRGYSRRASVSTLVPAEQVDVAARLLTQCRSKPTLCVASIRYSSLLLFGLISFEVSIDYAMYSQCSLEIEGLL